MQDNKFRTALLNMELILLNNYKFKLTKMENENKETKVTKSNSLNIIVEMILVLIIARHVIAIFSNIMNLILGDLAAPIYNIVVSILMIISLVLVMSKNKLGVILFFSLQAVNIIGLAILGTNDIMATIVVTLSICVVFTGLLFIRSNGVSAWSVILKSKK
jgi:hypothetical protein